ncbi:MAG: DUF4340 domain-containing protein [Phycisphaerales bacterium]
MSTRAVVVMLAITLLLGGAAFVALRKPAVSEASTGPLLTFDPARVVALRMRGADGKEQAIERVGDEWLVRVGGPSERVNGAWPAGMQTVRGGLRFLAALVPERAETAPGEIGSRDLGDSVRLDITLNDGTSRVLRVAPRAVGGLVLASGSNAGKSAEGSERVGWVSADLHGLLVASGLKAWRDPAAIPGLGPDVWRISLNAGGAEVEVARQQGRWSLRKPIQAPADAEAIDRLVRRLASVTVVDYLDEGAAAGAQTDAATVEVEWAERGEAGGEPRRWIRRLVIGSATDLGGRTVSARAEVQRGAGPTERRQISVLAEPLAELRADAAALVSRRSIEAPAADVGQMEIRMCDGSGPPRIVVRTLDGWTLDGRPTSKDDAGAVEGLLLVLASAKAAQVVIGDGPPLTQPMCLTIATVGATPIAEAKIGIVEGGGVAIRVGEVTRVYAEPAAATAHAWLAR